MTLTKIKTTKKIQAKRVAISFAKTDPIIDVIKKLEIAYYGLDTSSITKLALVELLENKLFTRSSQLPDSRKTTPKEDEIINDFINSPDLMSENETQTLLNSLITD